jgi:crotonobetainyl-CoA:carnitine CoA-transferase CaiB-like acyl-CoA transferase
MTPRLLPTPPRESSGGLLEGVTVLDMSQFLSGPFAALRLLDLGARVIKIERPDGGDLCRRLYLSDTEIGGDSTLFHAINRGKESFSADFKSANDIAAVKTLIARADVVIQNFRPGVIERLGLDYASAAAINPRIVYASITGYGSEGPWKARPGQDLLAQARSGVMWLNGDADQGPVPFGLAVADLLAGNAIVQGILAALVRRGVRGVGAHVETSLLEALIDFQFEVLTTHMNDGGRLPTRSQFRNAHAYLAAPYGVYRTRDGWLALAMTPLDKLAAIIGMPEIAGLAPTAPFTERDSIKRNIAEHIATDTTKHWLAVLEPADIWCAEVLDWPALYASEGFRQLDMIQIVARDDGVALRTTRSPIRVNGERSLIKAGAPRIGEHTAALRAEFGLQAKS